MKQLGLQKTHIVSQVEHFDDDHHIYVVMKWANQSLVDFMKDHCLPLLTERELRAPSMKIIEALKRIHKVGFLHNSVSPSNILISRKHLPHKDSITVKLCGFSKCIPIDLAPYVQNPPTTLFSAPEVITEGTYSTASDVWALGATLFTLANGRLPFRDSTEILTEELDWSNRNRGQFDPDFVQIVSSMLRKEAAQRPSLKKIASAPFFK